MKEKSPHHYYQDFLLVTKASKWGWMDTKSQTIDPSKLTGSLWSVLESKLAL